MKKCFKQNVRVLIALILTLIMASMVSLGAVDSNVSHTYDVSAFSEQYNAILDVLNAEPEEHIDISVYSLTDGSLSFIKKASPSQLEICKASSTRSFDSVIVEVNYSNPNYFEITITNNTTGIVRDISFSATVSDKLTNNVIGSSPYVKNYASILSFSQETFKINLAQKHCDEKINWDLTFTTAFSLLPESLSGTSMRSLSTASRNLWNMGRKNSIEEAIDYHFNQHGSDPHVNAENIVDYTRKAADFLLSVKTDLLKLSEQEFNEKYTVSPSTWATPCVKYKHKINKQFIHIADFDNNIISYGSD